MRGTLFLSFGLLGISTILIVLLIVAGSSNHVLVDWYYLKANTSALSVSSKLSNSTFLSAISKITGNDLVGSNATATSLDLGNWTTVSLFTSCTDHTNSSVTCTTPRFGYSFNPSSGLKLDNTGLQGSSGLVSIPSYGGLSRFLGIAYIISLLLTTLTVGLNILSCCVSRAIIASSSTSILTTILLLAASSASIAVFSDLRGKFNTALSSSGIKTAVGSKLFIISWVATVLMVINSIMLCISYRRSRQSRRQGMAKGVGVIDHTGLDKTGMESGVFAPPKRTKTLELIKRVGTWRPGQKYTQVEKQPVVRGLTVDEDILNGRGFEREEEEEEEIELVRNSTRGIPLQPFRSAQSRDVASAYEPFRHGEA